MKWKVSEPFDLLILLTSTFNTLELNLFKTYELENEITYSGNR